MLSKKEKKLLQKIEKEYRTQFNAAFVETMLDKLPIDETDCATVKIPSKKKILKILETKLNPDSSILLSGMLTKFINEKYEVMKK